MGYMKLPILLKNNAARKAQFQKQAEQADRFEQFVKELQELCTKFHFKDYDEFLEQAAAYQGITVDELRATKAESPVDVGAEKNDEQSKNRKRFFLTEAQTAEAKEMADKRNMSDKEIAEHFGCKEDLIKRRREGGFVYKAPGKPKAPE